VAQHDRSRLPGWDLPEGIHDHRTFRKRRGVRSGRRPADATDDLADLAKSPAPPIGDGDVDRDPVQPCLGGGIRTPRTPGLERSSEGLLRTVLSRGTVA
jgi:hypothetical protein